MSIFPGYINFIPIPYLCPWKKSIDVPNVNSLENFNLTPRYWIFVFKGWISEIRFLPRKFVMIYHSGYTYQFSKMSISCFDTEIIEGFRYHRSCKVFFSKKSDVFWLHFLHSVWWINRISGYVRIKWDTCPPPEWLTVYIIHLFHVRFVNLSISPYKIWI